MERKEELLTAIKAICRKAGFRPKFYESLEPDSSGRIEITVAAGIYLEDEHDTACDDLCNLTRNDTQYVVSPCGSLHVNGPLEAAGLKQIY